MIYDVVMFFVSNASRSARFVDTVAAAGGSLRVWDTRKTTPGLRPLEKAAVRAGGGANHRGNLSDWVLLKDNHLELFGIADAVARARHRWPGRTVHVECGDLEEGREALAAMHPIGHVGEPSDIACRTRCDRSWTTSSKISFLPGKWT